MREIISEKVLERRLYREVIKLGGEPLKFSSSYKTGYTDRLLVMPGFVVWVEVKTTGKKLTPKQAARRAQLERLRQHYFFIDDHESLDICLIFLRIQINTINAI